MDVLGSLFDAAQFGLSRRAFRTLLALLLSGALVADHFVPGTLASVLSWLAVHFGSGLQDAARSVLVVLERQAQISRPG